MEISSRRVDRSKTRFVLLAGSQKLHLLSFYCSLLQISLFQGSQYGPTFTTGDIVGCGVNLINRTLFFTKNGTKIGIATTLMDSISDLFPVVGLQTPLSVVDVNFGQKPFMYATKDEFLVSFLFLVYSSNRLLSSRRFA